MPLFCMKSVIPRDVHAATPMKSMTRMMPACDGGRMRSKRVRRRSARLWHAGGKSFPDSSSLSEKSMMKALTVA